MNSQLTLSAVIQKLSSLAIVRSQVSGMSIAIVEDISGDDFTEEAQHFIDDQSMSIWYITAKVSGDCTADSHCLDCEPNGNCDACNTIDGRNMEVMSEYVSTCDHCGEPFHHDELTMDTETQLGYCDGCIPKLSEDIVAQLK